MLLGFGEQPQRGRFKIQETDYHHYHSLSDTILQTFYLSTNFLLFGSYSKAFKESLLSTRQYSTAFPTAKVFQHLAPTYFCDVFSFCNVGTPPFDFLSPLEGFSPAFTYLSPLAYFPSTQVSPLQKAFPETLHFFQWPPLPFQLSLN